MTEDDERNQPDAPPDHEQEPTPFAIEITFREAQIPKVEVSGKANSLIDGHSQLEPGQAVETMSQQNLSLIVNSGEQAQIATVNLTARSQTVPEGIRFVISYSEFQNLVNERALQIYSQHFTPEENAAIGPFFHEKAKEELYNELGYRYTQDQVFIESVLNQISALAGNQSSEEFNKSREDFEKLLSRIAPLGIEFLDRDSTQARDRLDSSSLVPEQTLSPSPSSEMATLNLITIEAKRNELGNIRLIYLDTPRAPHKFVIGREGIPLSRPEDAAKHISTLSREHAEISTLRPSGLQEGHNRFPFSIKDLDTTNGTRYRQAMAQPETSKIVSLQADQEQEMALGDTFILPSNEQEGLHCLIVVQPTMLKRDNETYDFDGQILVLTRAEAKALSSGILTFESWNALPVTEKAKLSYRYRQMEKDSDVKPVNDSGVYRIEINESEALPQTRDNKPNISPATDSLSRHASAPEEPELA